MKTEYEKLDSVCFDKQDHPLLSVNKDIYDKIYDYVCKAGVDELIFLHNTVLGKSIVDNNRQFLQNYIKENVEDYCYRVEEGYYDHRDRYVFVRPMIENNSTSVIFSFSGEKNVNMLIDKRYLAEIMTLGIDYYGKFIKL